MTNTDENSKEAKYDSNVVTIAERMEEEKVKELTSIPVNCDTLRRILQKVELLEKNRKREPPKNLLAFNKEAPNMFRLYADLIPILWHSVQVKCRSQMTFPKYVLPARIQQAATQTFARFCGKLLKKNYGRL